MHVKNYLLQHFKPRNSMKRILWATTFRDFKNNKNDSIQYIFLNSLKSIENVEIDLCVTMFGEKNVKNNILNIFPNSFFFESSKYLPNGVRYSQSLVMNNALELMKTKDYDALAWSTCDLYIPQGSFGFLSKFSEQEFIATSHPNAVIDENGKYKIYGFESGVDFFCFVNLSKVNIDKFIQINKNYPNYDFGIYEHLIISLAEIFKCNLINFQSFFQLLKFENDRKLTDESKIWLNSSWKNNQKALLSMLSDFNISKYYAYNMFYCSFKMFRYSSSYYRYYIKLINEFIYLFFKNLYQKIFKNSKKKFWELY